jgi:hypothetical protein
MITQQCRYWLYKTNSLKSRTAFMAAMIAQHEADHESALPGATAANQ